MDFEATKYIVPIMTSATGQKFIELWGHRNKSVEINVEMPDYPGPEQIAEAEEQHEGQRSEEESWVQVNRKQPSKLNSGTYIVILSAFVWQLW